MQPTTEDYARVLKLICGGTPINTLRQDYVYELFRRGLLEVGTGDRLQVSAAGQAACETGTQVPLQQQPT